MTPGDRVSMRQKKKKKNKKKTCTRVIILIKFDILMFYFLSLFHYVKKTGFAM